MNCINSSGKRKMPTLVLSPDHARILQDAAERGRPFEVCGIIAGLADRDLIAQTIIPLPNSAPDPATRYQVSPPDFIRAYYQIERSGAEVIAVYHSHPDSAPIPSQTDLIEATWPELAYLIIGMEAGGMTMRAWMIRHLKAIEIEIVLRD